MAQGGSPVTQAAIARLGVQVALPSRGDISRGLGWMPQVIGGIFKAVNQKKNAELTRDINQTSNKLQELAGTEANIQKSRDQFIRRAEQDGLANTLRGYKEAISKGKSMAKDAFEAPYSSNRMVKHMWKELGAIGYDGEKLFKRLYKSGARGYELLEEAAKGFYAMDDKGRKQLLTGLENELIKRRDIEKQLRQEKKDIIAALDKEGPQGTYKLRGKDMYAADAFDKVERELTEAGKSATYAQERFDMFNKRLNKSREGTAAYNQEVKTTRERLQQLTDKLAQVHGGYDKLAMAISQKVQNAVTGFRSVLQQSIITLTLFYYKLNQVVDGFTQFEKELINAQSIFQTTNETLFTLSNQIVRFGTEFGISYDNAARGLYQFASAGLSAEDSIKVLNDTLKLSMAVQGDHNTISKLTTQVIFGFGLQMDQATEVTDKFAHAINKSLIEYQDLASAIKFSMPFFVSSGQSLDTLLGALQILTNRALEAGIAGRGLRQALAEFTQHADDNAAAFRKLGVEILDTEGNMFDLTHIAHQFNAALGEQASDMEVMMTLMDDLNIRGATAFIHLVQNADEFSAAVDDLKNSAGAANEMAMIQQESLFNQIQILRNALLAPFLLADPAAIARGEMNEFGTAVHNVIAGLKEMLIVETENGTQLTKLGFTLRGIAIRGVEAFAQILDRTVTLVAEFTEKGVMNINMIKLYFLPLSILIKLVDVLGPTLSKLAVTLFIMNRALGLGALAWFGYSAALLYATAVMGVSVTTMTAIEGELIVINILGQLTTFTFAQMAAAIGASMIAFVAFAYIGKKIGDAIGPVIPIIIGLAVAIAAVYAALNPGSAALTMAAWGALAAAGTGLVLGGIAAFAAPETSDIDMSGYEAQLAGNYTLGDVSATGGSQEALYVNKLVYTDSNVSEQMRTSAQMQRGASGEFG